MGNYHYTQYQQIVNTYFGQSTSDNVYYVSLTVGGTEFSIGHVDENANTISPRGRWGRRLAVCESGRMDMVSPGGPLER